MRGRGEVGGRREGTSNRKGREMVGERDITPPAPRGCEMTTEDNSHPVEGLIVFSLLFCGVHVRICNSQGQILLGRVPP